MIEAHCELLLVTATVALTNTAVLTIWLQRAGILSAVRDRAIDWLCSKGQPAIAEAVNCYVCLTPYLSIVLLSLYFGVHGAEYRHPAIDQILTLFATIGLSYVFGSKTISQQNT